MKSVLTLALVCLLLSAAKPTTKPANTLLPNMTTAQINALPTQSKGTIVYNTTIDALCVYNGTSWRQVSTTSMN